MNTISIIILILLVVHVLGQAAFVWRYGWFSPWRSTWQGVILMSQAVTLGLLVLFFIFDTIIAGIWPGRYILLIIILLLLTIESWLSTAGLLYVQKTSHPVSTRQGTGLVEPCEIDKEKDI